MALKERKTTLTDAEGRQHTYTCIPFRFDRGIGLKLRILKIVIKPLGDALGQALTGIDTGDASSEDAEALAGELDLTGLGAVLAEIPGRIIEAGGESLLAEILSQTTRSTSGGPDGEVHLKLNDELARAKAYSGGNYVEAYEAIKWVLGVNYAPFGTDGQPDWSAFFGGLAKLSPFTSAS